MNKEKFKTDCKYYKGDKPCKYNRLCENCRYYSPIGKRILIIKLDSKGDVLRTTPILRVLKKEYPNSHITWVISLRSKQILDGNKFIDRILVYNFKTFSRIQIEKFDLVISLDKAKEGAALATVINAEKKVGYGLSKEGNIFPLNKEAEYELSLSLSDELKFNKNKKTYQEMIFEIAGFKFNREEYIICLSEKQKQITKNFIKGKDIDCKKPVIGLNIGCGNRFPLKKWTVDGFIKLAKRLVKENFNVIILAGPKEEKRYKEILRKLPSFVIGSGYDNPLEKFISIVNCCNLVVSGDTLAMHIALGLKKNVVALFGPTCAQEIYMYERGSKIVSSLDCSPCYQHNCDKKPNCMDEIKVSEVMREIEEFNNRVWTYE